MVHRTNNTTDPSLTVTPTAGVKGAGGAEPNPNPYFRDEDKRRNDIQTGLFGMIEANLISHSALVDRWLTDMDFEYKTKLQ